ncbi:FkbM family methyltransferase [Flavobacterium aquidurense]|uniref:FkbM family methyltransferase n=1 Tax=Flavobacterium aquidurense TaxID=362413 RepID=UPI00285589F8|nr:FkbM family methyltransferase [Flavobacterium aquidurense]MDR7372334.1 FkbM family methyltransferase [Flavobacterium aquidurense]
MIKKAIKKIVRYFFKSNTQKDNLLNFIFKLLDRDPLLFAYNTNGILNYENEIVSGENFLILKVLPKFITTNKKAVFFDVGANIGEYSVNIASIYPNSLIYSFEPNSNTYNVLKQNVYCLEKITPINIGLSDTKKESEIFTYLSDLNSQHASLYEGVFNDLHNDKSITSIKIELDSLDNFCYNNKIGYIDFLKIDTEGHELDVLKGSMQMIKNGGIKIIQFEFNEMNVISRVFLKDFYEILIDYKIYRLSEKGLIPLFQYDSKNEIFKFQNLLAIHNTLL